ncbi:GFA family protein [Paracoccaceae bacterium Fryx2]|nr:GFA family protein [Paracoccaceae bacterium Fryx2]
MQDDSIPGSCLCGAVAFQVTGPLRPVVACHCTQCRKTSGHFWAASSVPLGAFRLTRDAGLRWFRASPTARRGFCGKCGASLFWQPDGEDRISFAPAALDAPTGLHGVEHIFTEDAGDYYAPEGPPPPPAAKPETLHAACLCRANRFSLPGPAGTITACHCSQCRKTSGHFSASFDAEEAQLTWESRDALAECASPNGGRRGFCTACGSSLYFRAADGAFSAEAGAIDGPTGGRLANHIFTADKGDHYRIDDGLPQSPGA